MDKLLLLGNLTLVVELRIASKMLLLMLLMDKTRSKSHLLRHLLRHLLLVVGVLRMRMVDLFLLSISVVLRPLRGPKESNSKRNSKTKSTVSVAKLIL